MRYYLPIRFAVAIATALLTLTLVAGCGTLRDAVDAAERSPATARLVTDQLTRRFVAAADDPAARAARVRAVVATLGRLVDGGRVATLGRLVDAARDEVDAADLAAADRSLALYGLERAREALAGLVDEGSLDSDERGTVGELLDWIDAAAAAVIREGTEDDGG